MNNEAEYTTNEMRAFIARFPDTEWICRAHIHAHLWLSLAIDQGFDDIGVVIFAKMPSSHKEEGEIYIDGGYFTKYTDQTENLPLSLDEIITLCGLDENTRWTLEKKA